MNIEELNNYICDYCRNDITKRAIMLTADWGVGKSYYAKNTLIPFLDQNNIKSAYVSLYGLPTINDICKSLYIDLRFKSVYRRLFNKTSKEVQYSKKAQRRLSLNRSFRHLLNTGVTFASTIVKGAASHFNVDIDFSLINMSKIYRSVNLTNKLIILDDIERSQIDIDLLLGFINGLVENDGAKVLLIANERELACELSSKDLLPKYYKEKEKAIGDTVHFYADTKEIVRSILKSFSNEYFNQFIQSPNSNELIEKINNLMSMQNTYNLRQFIYACQKTVNLFNIIDNDYRLDFLVSLFLQNIALCLQNEQNSGRSYSEYEKSFLSSGISYEYKSTVSCFLFIRNNYLDEQYLKNEYQNYIKNSNRMNNDKDIDILRSYYLNSQEAVCSAIDSIELRLKSDVNDIPITFYGNLGNLLIAISEIMTYGKIQNCLDEMIENAVQYFKTNKYFDISITSGIQLTLEESKNDLSCFIDKLNYKKESTNMFSDLDFSEGSLKKILYNTEPNVRDYCYAQGTFINLINIEHLINCLKTASPNCIHIIRELFLHIYNLKYDMSHYKNDLDQLEKLKNHIISLTNDEKRDQIEIAQLKWLECNLSSIMDNIRGCAIE